MKRKKVIEMNTIKSQLALHGITSKELSKHLQVNQTTVSLWSSNKIQPDLRNFYLIADFIGVNVSDLLRDKEEVIEDVKEWHKEKVKQKQKR